MSANYFDLPVAIDLDFDPRAADREELVKGVKNFQRQRLLPPDDEDSSLIRALQVLHNEAARYHHARTLTAPGGRETRKGSSKYLQELARATRTLAVATKEVDQLLGGARYKDVPAVAMEALRLVRGTASPTRNALTGALVFPDDPDPLGWSALEKGGARKDVREWAMAAGRVADAAAKKLRSRGAETGSAEHIFAHEGALKAWCILGTAGNAKFKQPLRKILEEWLRLCYGFGRIEPKNTVGVTAKRLLAQLPVRKYPSGF